MFAANYFAMAYFASRYFSSAVGKPALTLTLVLHYDPTWIGNSKTCIAVNGFVMSNGDVPIAPWEPQGTQ